MKQNSYIPFLLLLIPTVLVFKAFFLPGPLAWGDAPFYNNESLSSLVNPSSAWANQSVAGFGKVNNLYWIYPISFLYGSLHKILGLPNNILIRLLFYFPAILGSLIFPALLAKHLGYSRITQFFTSLVYTFNTTFLLIVDGGQVGVALAYGIFPLSLLYLRKLRENTTLLQFYKTLGAFMLLVVADVRIAIICFLTFLVWTIMEVIFGGVRLKSRHLRVSFFFCFSIIGLSAYWLIPAFRLLSNTTAGMDKPLELNSLLNSLFLFQPHWPANEFGRVFPVPFYFVGIPLLIFGSLLIKKKKVYVFAFCFLLFAFFTKGTSSPLGGVYELIIDHLPLGVAFRDSSKFFISTILFGGLLVGVSADELFRLVERYNKVFGKILLFVFVIYLLSLVSPALAGRMNGVLAGRRVTGNFVTLNDLIRNSPGSFRTVWFPENHPWAYSTFEKPAVDARTLVDARPFANLNTGTQDRFNFLHDSQFVEWFKLFGIKYLVFSGDPRKASLNEEERYDWNDLLSLVGSTEGLRRVGADQNLPLYEVPNIKPHIFGADKLMVVVGSDDIYEKLSEKNPRFSPANQPFLFVEDGKWDPTLLTNFTPESVILIMNDSNKDDLAFSFLQKDFVLPEKGEWAVRSTEDYLKYKYELLVNNINFTGFDYGKGIAFSTRKGEKLTFDFPVSKEGMYILAQRGLDLDGKLKWIVGQPQFLTRGTHKVVVENKEGKEVTNIAAIVPKEEWDRAQGQADDILKKFEVVKVEKSSLSRLDKELSGWTPVDYEAPRLKPWYLLSFTALADEVQNGTQYLLNIPEKVRWIIFTDSFNSMWELRNTSQSSQSYPFYSAVNGFAVTAGNAQIVFKGQEAVYKGLYLSAMVVIVLVVIFLGKRFRKK